MVDARISLIWGETDAIVPVQIGSLLCEIMDAAISCFVVGGAWHSPGDVRDGEPFASAIREAISRAVKPGRSARALGREIAEHLNSSTWCQSFHSTLNRAFTASRVERQHQELRELFQKHVQDHPPSWGVVRKIIV